MKNVFIFNYKKTYKKIGGEFFSVDRLKKLLEKNKYKVFYYNDYSKLNDFKIFKKNNILYFNGIFHLKIFFFLIISYILKLKIVISPKGELLPGAFLIKKNKKIFFYKMLKFLINKNTYFHSTSKFEYRYLKKEFANNSVYLARDILSENFEELIKYSNLILNKKFSNKQNLNFHNNLKIVFYSTVGEKKNLKFAINIIKKLKRKVIFDVYGNTYDKKYLDECISETKLFNDNINFNYHGAVKHSDVLSKLSRYHILIHPTLSENFGYAILEAMMSGCFLLISKNTTPWSFVNREKIGKEINLNNPKKWYNFIDNFDSKIFFSNLYLVNKYNMLYKKYFNNFDIKKENLSLFKNL